eukprot:COSAG02_NODE_7597_length_2942_cov_8.737953_3_plen_113_part_00
MRHDATIYCENARNRAGIARAAARPSCFSRARQKGQIWRDIPRFGAAQGLGGGVLGLPTGVRAGDKISEACTCRSARPRAAAPLQKFCAALIWHWRHDDTGHKGLMPGVKGG